MFDANPSKVYIFFVDYAGAFVNIKKKLRKKRKEKSEAEKKNSPTTFFCLIIGQRFFQISAKNLKTRRKRTQNVHFTR